MCQTYVTGSDLVGNVLVTGIGNTDSISVFHLHTHIYAWLQCSTATDSRDQNGHKAETLCVLPSLSAPWYWVSSPSAPWLWGVDMG
jgi:hypothetical protein